MDHHTQQQLLSRFPRVELSYETIVHTKVEDPAYTLALAISTGKKAYAWFTFYHKKTACYILDVTKEGCITKLHYLPDVAFPPELAIGTVLYGTVYASESANVFLAEDIQVYKGVILHDLCFSQKLGKMAHLLESVSSREMPFALPAMWVVGTEPIAAGYTVHHVQYRNPYKVSPYINYSPTSIVPTDAMIVSEMPVMREKEIEMDVSLPQFRLPTVFWVKADRQFDIYHLYARGKEYCGVAGVPTYANSVALNRIFRHIRENENLDYIEESDDESEFEDVREDKWVDLEKEVKLEFTFSPKCRKFCILSGKPTDKEVVDANALRCNPEKLKRYPEKQTFTKQHKDRRPPYDKDKLDRKPRNHNGQLRNPNLALR